MKSAVIAFYNTENFFDVHDDAHKFDDFYTKNGQLKWDQKRYNDKVRKISKVIGDIGVKQTTEPPLIMGLAEIEGKRVLNDLIYSDNLLEWNYDYIHFESKDERGIDNAILYRTDKISVIKSSPIQTVFHRENEIQDFTRDVLYVKFLLEEMEIHTFTVHLPSRRNDNANLEFRNKILEVLRMKVDEILVDDPHAYILIMGDFNGNPNNEFAQSILKTNSNKDMFDDELYNPMLNLGYGIGTLKFKGKWQMYDQMLFSKQFFIEQKKLNYHSTHIYNEQMIRESKGKFIGYPFRTFAGRKYLGGYSDHFPIFTILNY